MGMWEMSNLEQNRRHGVYEVWRGPEKICQRIRRVQRADSRGAKILCRFNAHTITGSPSNTPPAAKAGRHGGTEWYTAQT